MISDIFKKELKIVNIGLKSFSDNLRKEGVPVIQVDWRPSLGAGSEILEDLGAYSDKIEVANKKALDIILNGRPVLTGMDKALDVVPGMKKNMILHAGPPVLWEDMCGPMRGAVMGALIYVTKNRG